MKSGLALFALSGACSVDGSAFGGDGGGGASSSTADEPTCGGSANRYDVWVDSVVIHPLNPGTGEPWDWNGEIPDWLLEATASLGEALASTELMTAAEILQLVDEYAPELLEGTVPPDPIVTATRFFPSSSGSSAWSTTYTYTTFGYTTTTDVSFNLADDTYEPALGMQFDVRPSDGGELWIDLDDEDLAIDDWIGTVPLDEATLASVAGCGVVDVPGMDGIYSAQVEVIGLN